MSQPNKTASVLTPTNVTEAASRSLLFYGLVAVILAVSIGLRFWHLGDANLWTDEAHTELCVDSSLSESIDLILGTGTLTPVYFFLLRVLPHDNETLLRLPSAILGVVGVGLFMFLVAHSGAGREATLWAGALLAVNPYHLWLSRTARPYILVFVLTLVVIYYFILLARGQSSRRVWLGFLFSSMIAYMTHYTTMVLAVGQLLLLLFVLRRSYTFLKRWLVAQVIAAIPAVIWGILIVIQHTGHTTADEGMTWIKHPTLRDLFLTFWNMTIGHTRPIDGSGDWYLWPGLLLGLGCLWLGIGFATRRRRVEWGDFYWVLLLLAGFGTVFAISAFFRPLYVDRYFMVLLPALLLLLLRGARQIPRHLGRGVLTLVILTGLYNVLAVFDSGVHQREDWESVVAYFQAELQPGDAIITDKDNTFDPFQYYFTVPATNPVILLKETPDTAAIEQSAERIWIIYRNPNENIHWFGVMPDFDPYAAGLSPVGDWLIQHRAGITAQREFAGVKVFLWESRLP